MAGLAAVLGPKAFRVGWDWLLSAQVPTATRRIILLMPTAKWGESFPCPSPTRSLMLQVISLPPRTLEPEPFLHHILVFRHLPRGSPWPHTSSSCPQSASPTWRVADSSLRSCSKMESRVSYGASLPLCIMEVDCVPWLVGVKASIRHFPRYWIGPNRILANLRQDIEIAINANDQQHAFELLLSHGLSISTSSEQQEKPASFKDWYESTRASSPSQYYDRRKTRLVTPIYELPATGNPLDDMLRPFIIVYSAEEVGLPPIASPMSTSEKIFKAAYVALSAPNPDIVPCDEKLSLKASEDFLSGNSMVPTFNNLVRSEMHVLLMHAELHSPVWGQHMAQLSELVHSRACVDGLDNLQETVADERLNEFISWFEAGLKGEADYERLESLQETYREVFH